MTMKRSIVRTNLASDEDKAEALCKDISTDNFNGIDYALVRNEVVSRKPAM